MKKIGEMRDSLTEKHVPFAFKGPDRLFNILPSDQNIIGDVRRDHIDADSVPCQHTGERGDDPDRLKVECALHTDALPRSFIFHIRRYRLFRTHDRQFSFCTGNRTERRLHRPCRHGPGRAQFHDPEMAVDPFQFEFPFRVQLPCSRC
jgi:hypothetical protein